MVGIVVLLYVLGMMADSERCEAQWIEHHKALGVGRIYVFDHGSEVPLNGTLRRYIASRYVRYEYSTMGFHNSTGGQWCCLLHTVLQSARTRTAAPASFPSQVAHSPWPVMSCRFAPPPTTFKSQARGVAGHAELFAEHMSVSTPCLHGDEPDVQVRSQCMLRLLRCREGRTADGAVSGVPAALPLAAPVHGVHRL